MKRARLPLDPPAPGLNDAFARLALPAGLPLAPAPIDGPVEKRQLTAKKGRLILRRETAHRGGKAVLIVDGFAPGVSGAEIKRLARELRQACGCGGTQRERVIELQGEPIGQVRALLEAEGYTVDGVR